ncbi:hypothetical protein DFH29DRAFT_998529 [Suillus ampliporus]|nr:hypothetical protein DFH29DRAFT_998529 [Suillus ampliporus]
MQALGLALRSSLGKDGERGDYAQDGQPLMARGILAGPKPSVSSFLFDTLSPWIDQNDTSASSATIKGLSRAGKTATVIVQPLTKSSDTYSNSCKTHHLHSLSIQHTLPANPTQQTHPLEEYMETQTSFSQLSPFPIHSNTFSMTPSSQRNESQTPIASSHLLSTIPTNVQATDHLPATNASAERLKERRNKHCFTMALQSTPSVSKPTPHKEGLIPAASILHPHCLARDRLKLWCPVESRSLQNASGKILAITDEDLQQVITVMNTAWTQNTRESYGAGLLVFHVFCDTRGIPELQRCPVNMLTILAFVASCAGAYAGRTLANYVFAIHAWHILHGQTWEIQQSQLKSALDGAASQAPPDSKCTKREPFTIAIITQIRNHLDLNSPLNAAVFACLTTAFYSLTRLGELTVKSIKVFTSDQHRGVQSDLDESIELRPSSHSDRFASLDKLAHSLFTRFQQRTVQSDLDESIELHRAALALHPPGHSVDPPLSTILPISLSPDSSSVASSSMLMNPSSSIELHLHSVLPAIRGTLSDRDEAYRFYLQLSHLSHVSSRGDFCTAILRVVSAEQMDHGSSLEAHQTALKFLDEHVAFLSSPLRPFDVVRVVTSTLAVHAFSCCLRRGAPTTAVELVEQGCAVFWTQLARFRTPLDELSFSGDTGAALAEEVQQLSFHIRNAFDDDAAEHGSVIIVNACKYSCDALIILSAHDPVHVPLDITQTEVSELSSEFQSLAEKFGSSDVHLISILRQPLDSIVDLIVEALRESKVEPGSRIWWYLIDKFTLLPLHAIGPYEKRSNSLSQIYISSYTPTLATLLVGVDKSFGPRRYFGRDMFLLSMFHIYLH